MSTHHFLEDQFPFLLDGGLSNVLEAQGHDLNHPLWTALLLEKNPEAIVQAHLAYLEAGAQCITTASYQASIPGLMEAGYSKEQAKELILKSTLLAETAIQRFWNTDSTFAKPLIAASIGPYGAYLADGSEYRGNYGVTDEVLFNFHLERIQLLDASNADVLAVETIPSAQEAQVLADILTRVDKPAWVSFSCKDGLHLNDGSQIQGVVTLFKDHPKVFALGINCTKPEYISGLIQKIKAAGVHQKIIVYPNSGEAYHAESKTWLALSEPKSYVDMTKEWIKLGAELIGGCCRISPAQISQMRKVMVLVFTLLFTGLFSCQEPALVQDAEIPSAQVKADIDAVKGLIIGSFDDIWSGLDTSKITQYHTNDFILLENGIVWNNDSIRNYMNRERLDMEQEGYQRLNRFEFIKSVHNKSSIWLAYDNYGTWVKEADTLGTAHWLESAVAIKKEGEWMLEQLHSTRVRK
ncbi:MAG TPA: homocysteine S-methyltransferase [Saprospiraceae bacterium]|nr:homocysteine S-methyltransferase [Saprospiraceae bacterium]